MKFGDGNLSFKNVGWHLKVCIQKIWKAVPYKRTEIHKTVYFGKNMTL
jgi:hypothetical protein